MAAALSSAGVTDFLTGGRITVPLQIGCRGTLLILIGIIFGSAAFPHPVGNRVNGLFIFYGFHVKPRFRAALAHLLNIIYNDSIPSEKIFMQYGRVPGYPKIFLKK